MQIADIVASSITSGIEPDFYGNCELKYAEALRPRMYSRKGNYLSYGVKLYPWADRLALTTEQRKFVALFEVRD